MTSDQFYSIGKKDILEHLISDGTDSFVMLSKPFSMKR